MATTATELQEEIGLSPFISNTYTNNIEYKRIDWAVEKTQIKIKHENKLIKTNKSRKLPLRYSLILDLIHHS